jgi:hypothetical protein
MTPQQIIECVDRLDHSADQAIAWMSRGGFCCGADRVDGFCTAPSCRRRAIWAAGLHAREAAHSALRLIRLSEAATLAKSAFPSAPFDVEAFERIAAFMEGRKR